MQEQENKLITAFPFIDWLQPYSVKTPNASAFVCKFCIALHGLKAEDLVNWNHSPAEFEQHMLVVHQIKLPVPEWASSRASGQEAA